MAKADEGIQPSIVLENKKANKRINSKQGPYIKIQSSLVKKEKTLRIGEQKKIINQEIKEKKRVIKGKKKEMEKKLYL